MSNNILNNSYVIGIGQKNLVLNTLGRVYVKRQDKYYELKVGEQAVSQEDTVVPDIIIVNTKADAQALSYPGDNKLIVSLDGGLFACSNGTVTEISFDSSEGGGGGSSIDDLVINGILTVNYPDGTPLILNNNPNYPAFTINGNQLIYNLNAEYLNGLTSDEYAVKNRNEVITGIWQFGDINLSGIIGDGYTTLDMNTSTLIVDNLIVRNSADIPGGEGGDVNGVEFKVFGTNDETWVGKEFFIEEIYTINLSDIPNPSTTVDEFTGDYFSAIVIQRSQEYEDPNVDMQLDLSKYVTKDTVLKSTRTWYKVMDLSVPDSTLYLRALPTGGFEDEKKLVIAGHTSDTLRKGGITMNSVINYPPYQDIVNNYKYTYSPTGDPTRTSKLANNDNIIARFGILDGLASDSEFSTPMTGAGVYMKDNCYIKNPNINYGNNRILPDGSGKIGSFEWGAEDTAIASKTKLGVVQVGDGLEITAEGVLSSTGGGGSFYDNTPSLVIPTAGYRGDANQPSRGDHSHQILLKTINGESVMGTGDIEVAILQPGTAYFSNWTKATITSSGTTLPASTHCVRWAVAGNVLYLTGSITGTGIMSLYQLVITNIPTAYLNKVRHWDNNTASGTNNGTENRIVGYALSNTSGATYQPLICPCTVTSGYEIDIPNGPYAEVHIDMAINLIL